MRKAQTMWVSMLFLGLFILLAAIIMKLFLLTVLEVGINLAILYLIFLHLRAEIKKRKRAEAYAIGLCGSLIVLLLLGNLIPLWKATTITIMTILFGKLYLALTQP